MNFNGILTFFSKIGILLCPNTEVDDSYFFSAYSVFFEKAVDNAAKNHYNICRDKATSQLRQSP